jgi:hypothetical protein
MAIEVQEVSIRSVVSGGVTGGGTAEDEEREEKLRERILTECRQMMAEFMRADRER